jgi:hypothetical protein
MAHLVWTKGGEADLVAITADTVTLRSTIPSPPGSRIDAVLASDAGAVVKFKIHASRRQPDGSFVLEGRPLDLTKEMRERLAALVSVVRAP